jgi:hypothetical protein
LKAQHSTTLNHNIQKRQKPRLNDSTLNGVEKSTLNSVESSMFNTMDENLVTTSRHDTHSSFAVAWKKTKPKLKPKALMQAPYLNLKP